VTETPSFLAIFLDSGNVIPSTHEIVGARFKALFCGFRGFLPACGAIRHTTPHAFPSALAATRFRIRTKL